MNKSILPIMCNVFYNHLVPRIIHVLKTTFTLLIISILIVIDIFAFLSYIPIIGNTMVFQYYHLIWINGIPFQYINRYILDLFTNVIFVGAYNTKADNT